MPAPSARGWPTTRQASPPPSRIPERPLYSLLDDAVARHGTNVAIEYYGRRIRYAELDVLVDRFARALRRLGVRPGDRVSLCLPNVPQYVIAFFGILKAGAVVVQTNPLYTAPELEHQLVDSGASAIVLLDQFYSRLAAVRQRTPIRVAVLTSPADYLPAPLALAYRFNEIRERRSLPDAEKRPARPEPNDHWFKPLLSSVHPERTDLFYPADPVARRPGRVPIHRGHHGRCQGCDAHPPQPAGQRHAGWSWNEQPPDSAAFCLCVAPFFHVLRPHRRHEPDHAERLDHGAAAAIHVKDTLRAIKRYKPDLFPGVPTHLSGPGARGGAAPTQDLSSIKICISGSRALAARSAASLRARLRRGRSSRVTA